MIWREATSVTAYLDDREADEWPCEVRLSEDRSTLVVTYEEDAGYVEYKGRLGSNGIYELRAAVGTARLIFFGEDELIGTWIEQTDEGRMEGLWQIELGDVDEIKPVTRKR